MAVPYAPTEKLLDSQGNLTPVWREWFRTVASVLGTVTVDGVETVGLNALKVGDGDLQSKSIGSVDATTVTEGTLNVDRIAANTIQMKHLHTNAATTANSAYKVSKSLANQDEWYEVISLPATMIFGTSILVTGRVQAGTGIYGVRIYRDSTIIDSIAALPTKTPFTFSVNDSPGEGSFTYSIKARRTDAADGSVSQIFINAIDLQR